MKYAWIDKLNTAWPITQMFLVLEVSVRRFFEYGTAAGKPGG